VFLLAKPARRFPRAYPAPQASDDRALGAPYAKCKRIDDVRDPFNLSPELFESLDQLARHQRVTFSTVVQTAWAFLLSRHSQSHDVLFGVTHSGRSPELDGVESMVGLLINTSRCG